MIIIIEKLYGENNVIINRVEYLEDGHLLNRRADSTTVTE